MVQDNQVNRISMRQVSGFSRSKKIKADLGPESSFTDLPRLIKVGTANYFLVKSDEGYRMLSTMCPHQGGEVEDIGEDVFVLWALRSAVKRHSGGQSQQESVMKSCLRFGAGEVIRV